MERDEDFENEILQDRKRPKLDVNAASTSNSIRPFDLEWDEEFNNDQIEEVCIIAEYSQIATLEDVSKKKPVDLLKSKEDALRNKEGEVAILRSQLTSARLVQQENTIQHLRAVNDIRRKHSSEIEEAKKTINELKGEIEFKNLEIKGLTDTVKELEIKSPKLKFVEASRNLVNDEKKLFSLSQAITAVSKISKEECPKDRIEVVAIEKRLISYGERLKKLVVPEFFVPGEKEESVILMYETSPVFPDGLEHLRQDTLKWAGLPGAPSRLHRIYPYLMELIEDNCSRHSTISKILDITKEILTSLKSLLNYLCGLRINMECEERLVEDASPCKVLSVQDLMSKRLLKPSERGVEARRSLGVMSCIVSVYGEPLDKFISMDMLEMFEDIVKLITRIKRPLEFSTVLAGILIYLQAVLRTKGKEETSTDSLSAIKRIIEGVILCRPKLDVLREVVVTLTAATEASVIFHDLCKQSPADSCALYMDSRLNQALFFTPEACPLKLLQVQVKTLAHLSTSEDSQMDIARVFHTWFHTILVNTDKLPEWIVRENEHCCDITECFCNLISIILSQRNLNLESISIVERSILALREICKRSQKPLKNATLKLLPYSLRSSGVIKKLRKLPKEAAEWILTAYDSEAHNQRFSC